MHIMRFGTPGCSVRSAVSGKLLMVFALFLAAPVQSQEEPIEDIGKQEFIRSCAACHGEGAKGDGPLAGILLVEPPDLTSINKRNGGKFPASWVYRIVDGRNVLRPHGSREMPIWGDRYRADALRNLPLGIGADVIVHGRILSLVFYLEQIQED